MIGGYGIAGENAIAGKVFEGKKGFERVTIRFRAYAIDSWDNEKLLFRYGSNEYEG